MLRAVVQSGKTLPDIPPSPNSPSELSQPVNPPKVPSHISVSTFFRDPKESNTQNLLNSLLTILSSNDNSDVQARLYQGKLADTIKTFNAKVGSRSTKSGHKVSSKQSMDSVPVHTPVLLKKSKKPKARNIKFKKSKKTIIPEEHYKTFTNTGTMVAYES